MKITDTKYLESFRKALEFDLEKEFQRLEAMEESVDVGYRIQASAVYSSNIEGNSIDLNSYMNSQIAKQESEPKKEMQQINDLVEAYGFAKEHPLNEENLLNAHGILSRNLLIADKQGVYRNDRMGVFDNSGLVYLAIEPKFVKDAMHGLFGDMEELRQRQMSIVELFYHAALIHLKFAHIHPFWDGNGRVARLLEKWFLTENLNGRVWKVQSEKYYKEHLAEYYANINLGENFYDLNYDGCVPFLTMLANSVKEG